MHKNRKKFQALVLAAAITLAAVPGTAFAVWAAEPETTVEAQDPSTTEETVFTEAGAGIALPEVSLNTEEISSTGIPGEEIAEQGETGTEEAGTEEAGIVETGTEESGTEESGIEETGVEEPGIEETGTEEAPQEGLISDENSIQDLPAEETADEIPAEDGLPEEAGAPEETGQDILPEETGAPEETGQDTLPEEAGVSEEAGQDTIPEDSGVTEEGGQDILPEDSGVSEEAGQDTLPEMPAENDLTEAAEEPDFSEATEENGASEVTKDNSPSEVTEDDFVETTEENAFSESIPEDEGQGPAEEESVSEMPENGALPETETVTETVEEVREETDVEHEDNDQLFEEYAETVFEEAAEGAQSGAQAGTSTRGQKNTGDRLTGQDKVIYDALKAAALEIAGGQRDSGLVEIPLADLGIDADKEYTAEDLGLDYIYRRVDGAAEWNPGIANAVNSMLSYDAHGIFQSLWADCPYEMYWQKGAISYPGGLPYQKSASGYGDSWEGFVVIDSAALTFSMRVEDKYRLNPDDEFSVDISKTGAASAASTFAQSIVSDADNAGLSDYDRLVYYKDRICQEVVYNEDARQNSGTYQDGGPWALIYVFDQDPDTNVVCEGYSEAFQYLCGQTQFQSSKIQVYSPTGTMAGGTGAGPHKWNIVHMDDGLNYMADVTNSDEGSVGSDGRLFLKGIQGSVSDGYVLSWEEYQWEEGDRIYTRPAGSVSYVYDEDTRALFTEEELILSGQDYVPGSVPPEPPTPTVDEIAAMEAVSLYLTDRIGMRVHVNVNEDYIAQDDYITFICAGRTVTQNVSEAETDENGRLVFSLELAARQMTDQVTFFMTVDGAAGTSSQYSVRTYADTVLNGESGYSNAEKELIRAMLNYGSYTQLYAGYRTDSLAAQGLYTDGDDPVLNAEGPDLADYAYTYKLNNKTDGLKVGKASLLLGTDLSLRIYYEPGDEKTDTSYSVVLAGGSGSDLVYGYDDTLGMYYAEIEHITPTQIGDMYKLDFYAEDGQAADTPVASVTFGPLSYCRGKLESGSSSVELMNLCRALYYYWEAAVIPPT